MVPTTSHPPRRSTGRDGSTPKGNPLKSIRLTVTLDGVARDQLERFAAEKGLAVEGRGDKLSLVIKAATPEEALAQLGLLAGLIAPRA